MGVSPGLGAQPYPHPHSLPTGGREARSEFVEALEMSDFDLVLSGTVVLPDARMLCLFNWEDAPDARSVRVPGPGAVTDFWTGERLTPRDGALTLDMPPRSARLVKVVARG